MNDCRKIIIGLTGKAGAGKSTAAEALSDEFGMLRIRFAGPFKRMALAFGLTDLHIEGKLKEVAFPPGYLPAHLSHRVAMRMLMRIVPLGWFYPGHEGHPHPLLGGKSAMEACSALVSWYDTHRDHITTPRRFMQLLGTEWGREMISPSLWTDIWRNDLAESAVEHFGDILVVTEDCRFPNEAAAIRSEGGIVIGLTRDGAGSASGSGHSSETGIEPDFWIANDGSKDDLAAKVFQQVGSAMRQAASQSSNHNL